MKKKLILDDLAVESFVTGSIDGRGTVAGHVADEVPVEEVVEDDSRTTILPYPTLKCFCTQWYSFCPFVSMICP